MDDLLVRPIIDPFSTMLRVHRRGLGLTRIRLAGALGVDIDAVLDVENGRAPLPREMLARARTLTDKEGNAARARLVRYVRSSTLLCCVSDDQGLTVTSRHLDAMVGLGLRPASDPLVVESLMSRPELFGAMSMFAWGRRQVSVLHILVPCAQSVLRYMQVHVDRSITPVPQKQVTFFSISDLPELTDSGDARQR